MHSEVENIESETISHASKMTRDKVGIRDYNLIHEIVTRYSLILTWWKVGDVVYEEIDEQLWNQ